MRFGWSESEGVKMTSNITTGSVVKVFFGSAIASGHDHYVAQVNDFQPGHTGLYDLTWLESVPNYMRSGDRDLIEAKRVSLI